MFHTYNLTTLFCFSSFSFLWYGKLAMHVTHCFISPLKKKRMIVHIKNKITKLTNNWANPDWCTSKTKGNHIVEFVFYGPYNSKLYVSSPNHMINIILQYPIHLYKIFLKMLKIYTHSLLYCVFLLEYETCIYSIYNGYIQCDKHINHLSLNT